MAILPSGAARRRIALWSKIVAHRLVFFFCGATFLFFATTSLAAATLDPVAVVHSIYKGGSSRQAAFGLDPEERKKYFSKSTVALWDKADKISQANGDEVGPIDFDPSTNTQGADVASYSIVSSKVSGKTASVVVKLVLDNWYRPSPEDDIIRYSFVLEEDRWMIDDIGGTTHAEGWTLKQLLEFNSQDRTRTKE
jgi:hypothetical protein